jgi:hypothetical protein
VKKILQIEEAAMTCIALFALSFHSLGLSLWIWIFLFFSPDISMLGYLVNNRAGAITYNLLHHKGIAILLAALGYFAKMEVLLSFGILLFAHASFDRILGYGLKYLTDFKDTHLGSLEKESLQPTLR